MFQHKTLLITGGTGSFGHAMLDRFLNTEIGEIRVFSRDEKKQDDMRRRYKNGKIKYYLGDVRDLRSIREVMHGVDYVFHSAALKQVPNCEFFPMEAVRTNIIGTDNTLTAAIEAGVSRVICLSTDKAAYPINAMGMSKALMERVFVARSRDARGTVICGTRYGNVMCSRGSVIPLFIEQLREGRPVTVTDPSMTRFLMSLGDAVELVLFAFQNGIPGDLFVQKAPSCTIETLSRAVRDLFNPSAGEARIGIRHGEKKYETLLTREEFLHAEDLGQYFRIPADNRDLNYERYMDSGVEGRPMREFNSDNTTILSVEQVKEKLLKLDYIRQELSL